MFALWQRLLSCAVFRVVAFSGWDSPSVSGLCSVGGCCSTGPMSAVFDWVGVAHVSVVWLFRVLSAVGPARTFSCLAQSLGCVYQIALEARGVSG